MKRFGILSIDDIKLCDGMHALYVECYFVTLCDSVNRHDWPFSLPPIRVLERLNWFAVTIFSRSVTTSILHQFNFFFSFFSFFCFLSFFLFFLQDLFSFIKYLHTTQIYEISVQQQEQQKCYCGFLHSQNSEFI